MKKNIIFDKNLQLQNGIDVNTINSQTITVETVSQTGDLSIDGNLTISNNLDINGTTLNTSSNELNINKGLSSFKIPLNSINGVIYYFETSNAIFTNCDFGTISYLDIYIFDKLNYSLNSMGIDYSFTLQIDYLV